MTKPTLSTAIYRNPAAPIDERVQDLLSHMTIHEKVRQLDQYFGTSFVSETHSHMITVMAEDAEIDWDKINEVVGPDGIGCIHDLYGTAEMNNALQRYAVEETRLGIPILFSEEALHGLLRPGMTVYPHAIAMASTWNPELAKQIGREIAAETRSAGIHESFGPVLDLARDPRWGRVEETFGEDTHLASRMGVAMIQGLQGDSLRDDNSIIAEPKHFAVHGIPESGLNHSPVSIGANDIRTYHLPVFEAAYKEGGAINAMCAYHATDGVPCASDFELLTGVLRDEWQMPGFVRSDLGAIARLEHAHGTAGSAKEAIRQALEAGVDMQYYDYPHEVYQQALIEMVQSGELLEETVDLAVARVLRVKFLLGLFEKPYADPTRAKQIVRSEGHLRTALQTAREAICLLQNEGSLLPLRKDIDTIAVIGPSADKARLGDYTPYIEGFQPSTVLHGIQQAVSPNTRVLHAAGTGILDGELEPIPMAWFRDPSGSEGLHGEYYNNEALEGTPTLVRNDPHIHFNWAITKADQQLKSHGFSVRWTGKLVPALSFSGFIGTATHDSMRLWLDGELLVDGWGKDKNANVSVPVALQAGHEYDLRVEYVKDMNGVDITLGWSRDEEGIQEAVELARQADIAIVALGDSERTCGEGVDRSSLDLPGHQLRLLKAIHETGTPIVLVLQNGRPITLDWESRNIPSIVEVWYGGERAGEAIAEVLFGDYNPAGRLPVSFPRTIGQIPVCYNKRRGGQKHYVGGDNKPLYAFGHGLSYTTFRYDNLRVTKSVISADEEVLVSFDVTNDGVMAGDEVAQLYVIDKVASIAMPEKQLKHFTRFTLQPGETHTVSFTVTPRDLALLNKQLAWIVEPGAFTLQIGPSSDRAALTAEITVV